MSGRQYFFARLRKLLNERGAVKIARQAGIVKTWVKFRSGKLKGKWQEAKLGAHLLRSEKSNKLQFVEVSQQRYSCRESQQTEVYWTPTNDQQKALL